MRHLVYIALLSLFILSCESEKIDPDAYKSDATGLRGEVLIIMDDFYWEKEAGESLKLYFEKQLEGTPLPAEKQLSIRCYPHKNFNRNHKTNRNIVLVDFNEKAKQTSFEIEKNKWMKNQTYVEIQSPSMENFVEFMNAKGNELAELFLIDERNRVQSYLKAKSNDNAVAQISKKHDLKLIFPNEYTLVTNKSDFFSGLSERMVNRGGKQYDLIQSVFVYHYPYTSDSIFNSDYLIQKRNNVMAKYVKGETDNEYVTTNMDPRAKPIIDTVNFNGEFAVEIRGQWRMEGDFGFGGPFISLTTVDKKNNRVVTIEGMVFAPNSEKRELIRDLEAIAYSVSF